MKQPIAIAIDGPAAAGKSTLARALAERLGFLYVDTGALYRAVGYYVHTRGADPADEAQVVPLLEEMVILPVYRCGEQRILLNGEDVSEAIRLPEMAMAASHVSAIAAVRAFLLELQRGLAREHSVVMDGRDIGTVVLPDAQIKFFLTASPQARAKRRHQEFLEKGQPVEYEALLAETIRRDEQDSNRAISPLKPADNAVTIDSTTLTLGETIDQMLSMVKERLA